MFIQNACAMGSQAGGQGGGAFGFLNALLPLALMFVVVYFILIRPQQKKTKLHQDFLSKLAKGDYVVTSSGIYGKIYGVTDTFVTLELADNVKVKIAKPYIAGKVEEK